MVCLYFNHPPAESLITVYLGHYGNTQRTLVRKEEWQQAINDFKKARLLGDQAVADWVAEKQTIADRMPALTEVCVLLVPSTVTGMGADIYPVLPRACSVEYAV